MSYLAATCVQALDLRVCYCLRKFCLVEVVAHCRPKQLRKRSRRLRTWDWGFRCALDMYFQSRFGTPKRGPERGLNSRASLKDLHCTLMLVRRKSACKTSAGSSKILRWLTPLLGPNLDPKTGPKQRPKRRNENVIQFWTPFWGPYLDPKMGSAIGEFRCCPHMLCKQICDPAA